MSHRYQAVGWNRQKKIYDGVLIGGVVGFLGLFVAGGALLHPTATAETLLIRGLGAAAFTLLHVILSIGPLARLDPRFLPLLYNRRHLGVTMFVLALAHGAFATIQYHTLGKLNPLVSILVSNTRIDSLSQFPFQPLGLLALVILFLMAATSHDFWLANLGAPVWKALHMGVYLAYALIVMHVALGVLQAESNPLLATLLVAGVAWIVGLHLVAGFRERAADREEEAKEGWVEACPVERIPESRAVMRSIAGERVAVFRDKGRVFALSSVCQHQNGPLGEGRVVDGCVTCPWHGYQYRPEDGASPPPFTEKVSTFRVKIEDGVVYVDPRALEPGTRVEPQRIEGHEGSAS